MLRCIDCFFIRGTTEGHRCGLNIPKDLAKPVGIRNPVRDGRYKICDKFRPHCFRDFDRPLSIVIGGTVHRFTRHKENCLECEYRDDCYDGTSIFKLKERGHPLDKKPWEKSKP